MSHRDALNHFYYQYKTCLRNNFEHHLNKNNALMSYADECKKERQNITKYQMDEFNRFSNIVPEHQEELLDRVEEAYLKFNPYLWSHKQVENL